MIGYRSGLGIGGASRRPALLWLAFSWTGALLGVHLSESISTPSASLVMALGLGAAIVSGTALAQRGRLPPAKTLGLTALGLAVGLGSAVRLQEHARWERAIIRGAPVVLEGRLLSVSPYYEGRIVLTLKVGSLGRRGSGVAIPAGEVRAIVSPDELRLLVDRHPPDAGGWVNWPVRLYPFRPRGNPGEFDRRLWAARAGYSATAYIDRDRLGLPAFRWNSPSLDPPCRPAGLERLVEALPGGPRLLTRFAWSLRCRVLGGAPKEEGGVAAAMVLGQKDRLTTEVRESFSRAGMSHLLAVSGLHVGFVVLLATWIAGACVRFLFGRIPGSGRPNFLLVRDALLLIAVIGYVGVVGSPASAVRAGTMVGLALAAGRLRRPVDPWQLIGLAGTLVLLYNPLYGVDLGFQLSLSATAGVVAAAETARGFLWRRDGPILTRIAKALGGAVSISAGALLATTPLVASAFSVFSWVSPLTNLAALPATGAAVGLIGTGALVGGLWPASGAFLLSMGRALLGWLVDMAEWAAPWGAVEVAMPARTAVWGWYGGLTGAWLLLRGRSQKAPRLIKLGKGALLAGLALWGIAAWQPVLKGALGVVDVWVLDVGQGDASLIRGPWGRAALIDGGGIPGAAATGGYDVGEARLVPTLKRLGVRRLAIVVNTHPHEDHVHGLAAVIRQREAERVYASWSRSEAGGYRAFLEAARERGRDVRRLAEGMELALEPGASLRVLASGDPKEWEGGSWKSGEAPSVNDRSVALALWTPAGGVGKGRRSRFLFLGDLEREGQKRLLRVSKEALGTDALLVPHHGAAGSRLPDLYRAAAPEFAILSVGSNRFGHPAGEVLRDLGRIGAKVFRTDERGAVHIRFWPWGARATTVRSGADRY